MQLRVNLTENYFITGDIKYECNVLHHKPKERNVDSSAPTGRPSPASLKAYPHLRKR
jgi:hypothetical protein